MFSIFPFALGQLCDRIFGTRRTLAFLESFFFAFDREAGFDLGVRPANSQPGKRGETTLFFAGISYWNSSDEALLQVLEGGGLVVVPSAPVLCTCEVDPFLFTALQRADYAIIDSGYLAILMTLARLRPVRRISGLRLLERFFAKDDPFKLRSKTVLWVTPSDTESKHIGRFLDDLKFDSTLHSYYAAPIYSNDQDFEDSELFSLVDLDQPDLVVLCIGGGKQEKLGFLLRQEFPNSSRVILCTGAAISFLTGTQANIPTWADRLFLGWLFRVVHDPKVFLARYWSALRLPIALWKISQPR